MERLIRFSDRMVRQTPVDFLRYLYYQIDWQERMIAITGARGVGKTTLMLQYMRLNLPGDGSALYLALDDLFFQENTLIDFAEDFVAKGGTRLFLDEVHKYPDWSVELKALHDVFPELYIVFSGSSLLHVQEGKADLSRRVSSYYLAHLSFREFIYFRHKLELPAYPLGDILQHHRRITRELLSKCKPLAMIEEYWQTGMYPFFLETRQNFTHRLEQSVNQVLENDMVAIALFNHQQIRKMKRLLYVISTSAPFKPNISKIAERMNSERHTIYKYINYLERTGLINSLYPYKKGMSALGKPEKIYLNNPNLMWLFAEEAPDRGNLRETFFQNQLLVGHRVNISTQTDFMINGQWYFEIGGKNKTTRQIRGITEAWIVADSIESGSGSQIPLWLFGFLY